MNVEENRSMPPSKVLIVEDEQIIAQDLSSTLEDLGYDVVGLARNGEDGLQKVEDLRPDLILMDIRLNGVQDGIQAAQRIHEGFNLPVVYLTAYADEDTLERAKVTEPFGYIVKPFEERELRVVIEMAIYKHRMEKRLLESMKQQKEGLRTIETLHEVGSLLTKELDLKKLVQKVTDSATQLSGAQFGAFFYNVVRDDDEAYMLYTLSGAPVDAFSSFPLPRNTDIFEPTFRGEGVVRLDDVTKDARFGKNSPYQGFPKGHLPVKSYLAVPVVSRGGKVLGGLFFGHALPGRFTERHERIVTGIAAWAALAMENARLFEKSLAAREEFEVQVEERTADLKAAKQHLEREEKSTRTLLRIANKLSAALEIDELLDHLISECIELVSAEGGFAGLLTPEGMVSQKYYKKGKAVPYVTTWPKGHGLPGWLLEEKVPYLTNLAGKDSQIDKEFCAKFNVFNALSVPILDVDSGVIGFFEIHNKKEPSGFKQSDQETLVGVSRVAAIAMQNALAYREVQKTKNHLQQREEHFRSLIENALDIITVLEPDGTIKFESPAVERILGYPQEALIGKKVFEFVHPDDRALVEARFAAGLDRPNEAQTTWFRFRHEDGSWRVLEAISRALTDESGVVERVVVNSRDITERKQAEERIKKADHLLTEAQRMAHLGSWEWDIAANSLVWSEELYRIYGVEPGEFEPSYKSYLECLHPDDREFCEELIEKALRTRSVPDFHHRIVRPDGNIRMLLTRARVELDDHRRATRMVGSCQDVTEQKRQEDDLYLLLNITQEISETENFSAALKLVLQEVCDGRQWIYGEAWVPDETESVLHLGASYYFGRKKVDVLEKSRSQRTFARNEGLVGKVWVSKQPRWLQDVTGSAGEEFVPTQLAAEFGLKAAIGTPVIADEKVVAVLTFFMTEAQDEDQQMLELVSAVATQLGANHGRKQAEQALRDSEDRFRSILEGVKDYAIYGLDAEGRVVSWNAGAEGIHGFQATDIIGSHFSAFYPEEDRKSGKQRKALTKATTEGRFEDFGWRVRKDGSRFWANVVITPLLGETGELRGFSKVTRDLTQRKEAQDALRESRHLFENLFESSPDATTLVDESGQIVKVNNQTEALLGYTRQELIGQQMEVLLPERFRDDFLKHRISYVADPSLRPTGIGIELFARTKEGTEVPVDIMLSPLTSDQGTHIISVIRDITEKKRLQDENERNARLAALGKFSAMVAHEIRNPIGAIALNCRILAKDSGISDDSQNRLQDIQKGVSRVDKIISDILDFSRPAQPSLMKIDLHDVLRSSLGMLKDDLEQAGIKVVTSLEAEKSEVSVDVNQMVQVFINLFGNAKDAMPSGGELSVRTMSRTDELEVQVADSGDGIAADDLEEIFEPFFTTKNKGTGLGLAVLANILQQHKVEYLVDSEVGGGTRFRLIFGIG